ncbi:class I SAM-dependent methyltransferase [Lysinibacillus fusiformis]|uniref:class I SAM-dependent methyltransferase n=1 Tax=Lysinibacillus fusiformis TaxID=28031 RepID=UPI003D03190A
MDFENIVNSIENKKLYSFGTGSVYEKYKDFLNKYNFQGYIDNNINLFNGIKDQKFIHNPLEFKYSNQSYIIIMSSFFEEISKQLESYGLINGRDFCTYKDLDNCFNLHKQIETGHFYSPIPNTREIFSENYKAYERGNRYSGINLNIQIQDEFAQKVYMKEKSFKLFLEENSKQFYLNNGYFEYIDSITYFTLIDYFKPKKIIEIGSGFTSALALNTSKFFDLDVNFTFIEPFPERVKNLLTEQDYNSKVIEDIVQNVSVETLTNLDVNDFLFIDSSHVSKVNSDVNYLIFEVLPNLKKGTIIHFHDVFAEFEYPLDWIYRGDFWNESYILRAFLQYNNHFEIICFNSFIFNDKSKFIDENVNNDCGGSIWLRKII